jgi:hypothetical protein
MPISARKSIFSSSSSSMISDSSLLQITTTPAFSEPHEREPRRGADYFEAVLSDVGDVHRGFGGQ